MITTFCHSAGPSQEHIYNKNFASVFTCKRYMGVLPGNYLCITLFYKLNGQLWIFVWYFLKTHSVAWLKGTNADCKFTWPYWTNLGIAWLCFRSVCSAMRRCRSGMFFVAVRRTRSCLKLLALLLTGRKSSMQVSVICLLLSACA